MKVIGYIRVSTNKQDISLEVQREKLQGYAKLYDLQIVEIIADNGASAKSLNRTGLNKALNLLKAKKAEGLLIAKLDRLTRSVTDLGHLLNNFFQLVKETV